MPSDWFMVEELPNSHWMHVYDPLCGFSRDLVYTTGVPGPSFAFEVQGIVCRYYSKKSEWEHCGEKILARYLAEPEFGEHVNAQVEKHAEELFDSGRKLREMDAASLDNANLADAYELFWNPHRELNVWGMVTNVLEFENNKLTNYILSRLTEAVGRPGTASKPAELFSLLTTPVRESVSKNEEKQFLELAQAVASSPRAREALEQADEANAFALLKQADSTAGELVSLHAREFGWISYMYAGPGWDWSEPLFSYTQLRRELS